MEVGGGWYVDRVLPRDAPCGIPASFLKLPHQSNLEGAIPASHHKI